MGILEEKAFVRFNDFNPYEVFKNIKTPAYIIDELGLKNNGILLKQIQDETNAKILLALKCFSNYDLFPLLSNYLAGTEASGLFEARLGKEEMPNKEVHVFSAAFKEEEFDELLKYADHIVFNSVNQLKKYGMKAKQNNKEIGIRINPELSTQKGHEIYDPCSKGSRLGITLDQFLREMNDELINMLDGIHFHTLCQQNSDDLYKTLMEVDHKFSKYFKNIKWINFGGGHHITRYDYDIPLLKKCIKYAQDHWHVDVYLEPGEGVVLNSGFLITRVLDTFKSNDLNFIITDTSAACHMPDVVEMPYKPPLYKADLNDNKILAKIGGPTCLTGDNIGEYKFKDLPKENDLLIFGDMALYTTVKNNTFNGMPLPDIYILKENKELVKLTNFGYKDFKYRLGK